MGGLSIWHWIVVLIVLGIPVAIGLIVWLVIRATKRQVPAGTQAHCQMMVPHATPEQRLNALQDLYAKGLINEAEYTAQRTAILQAI
ncbi:Short C-terminal domain-containing protein [Pseudoxanthomonas sp. GM95]|uniref:SHOCT domain-containing protein n=1 Tax=Pseudoxanthomonas sp. GM95 TaxID=1881043 RepID=UPI0008CB3556|nr:SHOCT domain-containing protein [Pseudoxanthomonas sp. GM95]SEM23068.1 Short C-terminal domain-containing protein [Pseudoxanthomonas sp. GM95]